MITAAPDQRDFGIAVDGALRVDDCWRQLWQALVARPAIEEDRQHAYFIVTYRNDETGTVEHDLDAEHEHNTRRVASHLIGKAVAEKRLTVWLRLASDEAKADAGAFHDLDGRTWTNGFYRSNDLHSSNLEGRPLWVKEPDWRSFMISLLADRYGEHERAAASQVTARSGQWTEAQMTEAILQCGISKRDDAWDFIFKAKRSDHGWTLTNFREHWSVARGTKGMSGRPRG